MSMPNRFVVIRHGQSEGNVATDAAKRGDESYYTDAFRETPGHRWHLTEGGQEQAKIAGQWIIENISETFDRYYVSPFVRTRETAAFLGLPDTQWRIDPRLRERDWGEAEGITRREFEEQYPRAALLKKVDSLYTRMPGGESIADVRINRVRDFYNTLHRECFEKHVIVVTHGEWMWGNRANLEYMSDEEWVVADSDPAQRIHNTQIHDYSRVNPHTGEQGRYIGWTRRITPYLELDTGWIPIERHLFNNDDLLAQTAQIPHTIVQVPEQQPGRPSWW